MRRDKILELEDSLNDDRCYLFDYCADSEERSSNIEVCEGRTGDCQECRAYQNYLKIISTVAS